MDVRGLQANSIEKENYEGRRKVSKDDIID